MKRAAAAAAAALALFGSVPARADGPSDPRIRWETPFLQPQVSGVTMQISPPVDPHAGPLITMRTVTPFELLILGTMGEPFLRVGRDRSYGNLRSPTLGPALNPQQPAAPSPGGPAPLWKQIAGAGGVRWYERRAAFAGHAPSNPRKPSVLQTWTIEGTVRGRPVKLAGEIRWKPVLGTLEPKITRVSPAEPAVEVRAVAGPIPALQLRNGSGRTIQITGRDGKPFARIGAAGVEINVNSATYRDTRSLPPAPSAAVRFEKQPQTLLVWLERRAAYPEEPPEAIQSAGKRVVLTRWSIPGTIDGAPFEIAGTTEWVPIAAKSSGREKGRTFPVWMVVGPAAGVAAITASFIARRRARVRT